MHRPIYNASFYKYLISNGKKQFGTQEFNVIILINQHIFGIITVSIILEISGGKHICAFIRKFG